MAEKSGISVRTQEPKQKSSNFFKQKPSYNPSGSPAESVLEFQRTAGNQAVQRLIKSGALQAKLKIGKPNDIYEQEAEKVADSVMRASKSSMVSAGEFQVQRKCSGCEEELKRQLEEEPVQVKKITGRNPEVNTFIESQIKGLKGSGQPLSKETREFFEPLFGYDFSHVRVHTDADAAESAQKVNAKAFTLGKDVAFGSGQYTPETAEGKKLISHELTHVVQQGKSSLLGIQRRRVGPKNACCSIQKRPMPAINTDKIPVSSLYSSSEVIQRAMICSKRLEAPVIGWFANHAYIDDTGGNDCLGAGVSGNYAITNLIRGNFLKGCATKTDHSPDPRGRKPNKKPCEPKPGVTNVSQCLRNAFNSYIDPSLYKNPSGPNSNTFAGTLARACCKDASSKGLGWVPGWNHAPATPCPPRTTSPAPVLIATGLSAGGGFRGLMERDRQRVRKMLEGDKE